jgi:paraquat-inducible protein B
MHTQQHGIQQVNQARQITQQLINQTQQGNQMYRTMLQQEEQNIQMLEQILQREKQAVQLIQQSLQGHQVAIQRCQEVMNICNQMEHELTGGFTGAVTQYAQGHTYPQHQYPTNSQFYQTYLNQ